MLIHDVASCFKVSDHLLEQCYSVQAAVVKMDQAYPTGVPGYKIVSREVEILHCPFVLDMSEGQRMIVGAFKHRHGISYYYGVPVERVKDFKAPAKFDEELLWVTKKCSLPDVRSATVLENTESCKLKDKFEAILKLSPLFGGAKINSITSLQRWSCKSYAEVVKIITTDGERLSRKAAAEKGAAASGAGGRVLSKDGGGDAAAEWASARAALLAKQRFYAEDFAARFIVMENADALEACLKDLEKHALAVELGAALKKHAGILKAGGLLAAPQCTPLKKLLVQPAAAGDGSDSNDSDAAAAAATAAATTTATAAATAAATAGAAAPTGALAGAEAAALSARGMHVARVGIALAHLRPRTTLGVLVLALLCRGLAAAGGEQQQRQPSHAVAHADPPRPSSCGARALSRVERVSHGHAFRGMATSHQARQEGTSADTYRRPRLWIRARSG